MGGFTQWRIWSRHFDTSIPDGVIGIFHCLNPTGRTMTQGSTQPLKEVSGVSLGGKGQPCHFHVPIVWKPGKLSLLKS
jgi:hypothetical protein